MQPITDDLIESLLNEDEGEALDFKRDQYPFQGASADQKSELLKDILALANSWRRSDAFLLIGVDERTGARSVVVGTTNHLDDAQLQQFVNAKTQRPVQFRYFAYEFEGRQLGIIQVPEQERPLFLTKPYGKLRKEEVYTRRGSSTAAADLEETLKMQRVHVSKRPALDFVAHPVATRTTASGKQIEVQIGIRNSGSGSAVAPQVTVTLPRGCSWQSYGLDGNMNEGLPCLPSGGGGQSRIYGGESGAILHPGDARMITIFLVRPAHGDRVCGDVEIEFEISAQDLPAVTGVAPVSESDLNAVLSQG